MNDLFSSASVIDNDFWLELTETIRRGNCVLLLGPGVSTDDKGIPFSNLLARTLASDPALQSSPDLVDAENLPHVAQLFQQKKRSRITLELKVKEFYNSVMDQTTDFHQEMAALPFTLCINTTPDDFFFNALKQINPKEPIRSAYNFKRSNKNSITNVNDSHRPVVYNLYGTPSEQDSLVLTENDLIEFLVAVIKSTPPLPDAIRGKCGDKETSFLFVGFGFHQWYMRILLHILQAQGHNNPSFALEESQFFDHDNRQTAIFFSNAHLINFKTLSWNEFAKKLRTTYESLTPDQTDTPVAPLQVDAPIVFLCHAGEDADAVKKLGQLLHAAGINTWRDKQNLRAGDQWEQQLERVIKRQVDYVLVYQTPSMINRAEGVFFEEIKIAKKRHSQLRDGLNFLIPVTVENCPPLEGLEDFHTIPIDHDNDLTMLISDIRSDWNKPGRRAINND